MIRLVKKNQRLNLSSEKKVTLETDSDPGDSGTDQRSRSRVKVKFPK